ncbi:MAG TPA: integrase [Sulfurospirillum sp. UBA12182]|nr:MAG TPA: integrase [Sulfurospirillum sp. UBA12182]
MSKKLTVIQMANHLGVSKEAIYNRIRRGSLNVVVENGKKYILLTPDLESEKKVPNKTKNRQVVADEYTQLLKEQIKELKQKNEKLEQDKEELQKEKEKLLVESKEKIESIYKSRDEYIQNVLALLRTPALKNNSFLKEDVLEVDDLEEVDIVEQICESYEGWIGFYEYAKKKELSKKETKALKKKLKDELGKNKFIKESDGQLFVKEDTKLKKLLGK